MRGSSGKVGHLECAKAIVPEFERGVGVVQNHIARGEIQVQNVVLVQILKPFCHLQTNDAAGQVVGRSVGVSLEEKKKSKNKKTNGRLALCGMGTSKP